MTLGNPVREMNHNREKSESQFQKTKRAKSLTSYKNINY